MAPASVSVSVESALRAAVTVAAGPDLLGICCAEPPPPPADSALPTRLEASQNLAPFPENRFPSCFLCPPASLPSCPVTTPRATWPGGCWTPGYRLTLPRPTGAWQLRQLRLVLCPPTHGLGPSSVGCGCSPRAQGGSLWDSSTTGPGAGSLVLALPPGGASVPLSDPCDSAQLPAELGSLCCARPWKTFQVCISGVGGWGPLSSSVVLQPYPISDSRTGREGLRRASRVHRQTAPRASGARPPPSPGAYLHLSLPLVRSKPLPGPLLRAGGTEEHRPPEGLLFVRLSPGGQGGGEPVGPSTSLVHTCAPAARFRGCGCLEWAHVSHAGLAGRGALCSAGAQGAGSMGAQSGRDAQQQAHLQWPLAP